MDMVSYYNSPAMYRHQQSVASPGGQYSSASPMHQYLSYAGYHHQNGQVPSAPTAASFCMQQEEQQVAWHHAAPHPHAGMFHQEFQEYVAHNGMAQQLVEHDGQLPSPPITVSGSEMSSPGAGGAVTPPQPQTRPAPVRSPYEWIKKTSYQSQPNPGKTRTKDKYRVVYTDHQRIELEKEFTFANRYITIRRKAELAASLGLSERQIKIWFQNRRAKDRKQNKKRAEEKQQALQAATSTEHSVNQFQNSVIHHNLPGRILGYPQVKGLIKLEEEWPKAI